MAYLTSLLGFSRPGARSSERGSTYKLGRSDPRHSLYARGPPLNLGIFKAHAENYVYQVRLDLLCFLCLGAFAPLLKEVFYLGYRAYITTIYLEG